MKVTGIDKVHACVTLYIETGYVYSDKIVSIVTVPDYVSSGFPFAPPRSPRVPPWHVPRQQKVSEK